MHNVFHALYVKKSCQTLVIDMPTFMDLSCILCKKKSIKFWVHTCQILCAYHALYVKKFSQTLVTDRPVKLFYQTSDAI